MIIKFDENNQWEVPVIPQYEDYEYRTLICCECCENNCVDQGESNDEGIVGIAEDSHGRLMALHICPRCGKKWRCHITNSWNSPQHALMMLALTLFLRKDKYWHLAIKNK